MPPLRMKEGEQHRICIFKASVCVGVEDEWREMGRGWVLAGERGMTA